MQPPLQHGRGPGEPSRLERQTMHEIRNLLAVAIASVEGLIDGKLQPGPTMLSLLRALRRLSELIEDLPR